ncbi:hypothetical protein U9M48_001341 [Paspalum notatum var. saurae]|uniref:Reverse transcriptase domain-containing protein n=1 Tax=Paspalum notatum var. saurae TaxID=547442 RepID=A0AAQ3SIV3_PASNO
MQTPASPLLQEKNFIAKFQVGDQFVTTQEDKHQAALDFYDALIGSAKHRDYTLNLHSLGIQQHDLTALYEPFTIEKEWATVRDLPMDKPPGPDGFTCRFYKVCWDMIKGDMMEALLAVQRGHVFKFSLLNSAFITLFPKKVDALQVKDYILISLIHSFAKLVAKLLANWLAPPLPNLVSINQSAFVKQRSIQENFLVQQLVRTLHSKREPHILLKLDISKAFDSISWSFLLELMQFLGFSGKWCNLVSLLLSTSSTRILINGEPGGCFTHHHGLRQGDLLSPVLFILPIAFQQAKHHVSFYANDVVLFPCHSRPDVLMVSHLLDIFGHATGLKTNIARSSVTPIQCGDEKLVAISDLLPCEIKNFRCSYLGLPLSIRKPTNAELLPLTKCLINCQDGKQRS